MTAGTVLGLTLVTATVVGMIQARRMTRPRQDALRDPVSPGLAEKVRRGARSAAVLRAAIAALSLLEQDEGGSDMRGDGGQRALHTPPGRLANPP